MKLNKKGFSLIELLAVIVILSVIALIAVPIVLNVVEATRRDSFKSSVYGIISSLEKYYVNHLANVTEGFDELEVRYSGGVETLYVDDALVNGNLSYKGQAPTSGYLKLYPNGSAEVALANEKYCAYKEAYTSELTIVTGECPEIKETIKIFNVEQLSNIRTNLNESYSLISDIDMTNYNWEPIGTIAEPFTGELYGNGYKIINFNGDFSSKVGRGFFVATDGAILKDITFDNPNLTLGHSSGLLIGTAARTTIDNLTVNNLNITGNNSRVGGIVGKFISGEIKNSNIAGTIESSANDIVGGLIAALETTTPNMVRIKNNKVNLTNNGRAIVGGITGLLALTQGSIEISDNELVLNQKSDAPQSGGVVGKLLFSPTENSINCNIKDNIVGGTLTTSEGTIGGIVGTIVTENDMGRNVAATNMIVENNISDADIQLKNTGGGIAGRMTISALIKNNYFLGKVEGYNYIGGIVGVVYNGIIVENMSIGDIISKETRSGGIVSRIVINDSNANIKIEKNYVSSNVSIKTFILGGLVGNIVSEIEEPNTNPIVINNNAFRGNIASSSTAAYIGGLIGTIGVSSDTANKYIKIELKSNYAAFDKTGNRGIIYGGVGEIYNTSQNLANLNSNDNYWDTDLSGTTAAYSTNDVTGITGLNSLGFKTNTPFNNWDTSVWDFSTTCYPKLKSLLDRNDYIKC